MAHVFVLASSMHDIGKRKREHKRKKQNNRMPRVERQHTEMSREEKKWATTNTEHMKYIPTRYMSCLPFDDIIICYSCCCCCCCDSCRNVTPWFFFLVILIWSDRARNTVLPPIFLSLSFHSFEIFISLNLKMIRSIFRCRIPQIILQIILHQNSFA